MADQRIESEHRPTQAQLYDDLRRIGQLEDQKHVLQQEIEERTERLRSAIPTLEKGSLLHQMLSTSLPPKQNLKRKKPKQSNKH